MNTDADDAIRMVVDARLRKDIARAYRATPARAEVAVRPRYVCHGSVAGVLDIVNPRSRHALKVSIFDGTSGRAVSGLISRDSDDELHCAAREAFGSRVLMGGRVHRNDRGQPVRIEVDRMQVLGPADPPRLDWMDLLGAAPDLLEGGTVEEYLGRVTSA
jgi:hypothetical protein